MMECLCGEGHIKRLLLTCSLLFSIQSVVAADDHPIIISGGRIPFVFDPDQPGPYNQIVDLMRAGLDRPVEIEFFPITRAMRQMANDKYNCFAMALKHSPNWARLGMDANQYVFVGPVAWLKINLYTLPGQRVPTGHDEDFLVAADGTIADLKTVFEGHWSRHEMTATASFVEAFDLLVQGRVHGVLAYDVDVQSLAADHPLQGKFVSSTITVAELEDGLMCKSTSGMLPIILGLQENLDRLAADGTLDQILNQQ